MSNPLIVKELDNGVKILLYKGDITKINVQAIGNAANSSLLGGGGVDGAIHRAAGPELDKECLELHKKGGCPPGEARITTGGNLPAQYVIHTVGPIWHGGNKNEAQILANCYKNSIKLAKKYNIETLIFPSISTGIYGYPIDKAAQVAKEAVLEELKEPGSLKRVGWCLYDDNTFNIYKSIWEN